jgi:phospholipase/lecithinase/hemolysin
MQALVSLCRRTFLVLFAASVTAAAHAAPPGYAAMYVFGDSLSDTGNDLAATTNRMVPAIPPSVSPYATYWQGRFSNGPVAVEYLWQMVARKGTAEVTPVLATTDLDKKSAVNFAFGGAGTGLENLTPKPNQFLVPGLLGQVGIYKTAMSGKKPHPGSLYVVWAGANDYLAELPVPPEVVVGNIAASIKALHAMGARDFLVPNLPDLGITPLVKARQQSALFTQLTKTHNEMLATALNGLSGLPGIKIKRLDVFALGQTLVNSGSVNADVPALVVVSPDPTVVDCLFRDPSSCKDVPLNKPIPPFLYWDVLHPTTQVHGIIGSAMYNALQK